MLQREYRPFLPSAMSLLADRTSLPLPPVARFADGSAGRLWTGRPVDFSLTASRRVARTQARCRPGTRNCAESDSSVALRGSIRVGDSVRALGQLERRSQVSRQRRADVDRRAGDGVLEREPLGMQELALEPVATRDPVLTITADRMTDRRQVHTDLVGAAGLQDHPQQRSRRKQRARSRSGSGLRAACRCRSTSAPGRAGHVRSARRSSPFALTGVRRRAPRTRGAAACAPAAT